MKSSVYRICGPYGSQYYREDRSGLSAKEAKNMARQWNERSADGLGITMREYSERNCMNEGWFVSMHSGQGGRKTLLG